MQQHERVIHDRDLLVGVVDEVGRQVAAVKLHPLNNIEFVVQRLAVFNGDHAFFTDLLHGFGDQLADFVVRIGRNGTDLRDFFRSRAWLADVLQFGHQSVDGTVDPALEVHRVHSGCDEFHALANDCLGQDRRGRRTVTGVVAGLGSDFLDHLRAHVHELVFEFNFFGDGDTVFGDGWRTEGALEDHIATFWAEGDFDGVGEDVDALDHAVTCIFTEKYLLCSHCWKLLK